MLDFHKVMLQIEKVGLDSIQDGLTRQRILKEACQAYLEASAPEHRLESKLKESAASVLWPVAMPLEPLGTVYPVCQPATPVTVVATDGSQIMPSHHEIYNCYLLNVAVVCLSYGARFDPVLESHPKLYHRPEDLYPLVDRRRIHIDELHVSLERNLLELEMLAFHAISMKERGIPVVALLDGTLIPWSVEKMPESYRKVYFARMQAAISSLADERIPLSGYLSQSRAGDVVNNLRVYTCPYEVSNCRSLCGHLNEEDFPCSKIWPLSDRQLMSQVLLKDQRSAVFLSGASTARVLEPANRICFTYVNVGSEVARLEFPFYVHEDGQLLNLLLSVTAAQVAKGQGYPVALSEAHHLAVVTGFDRRRFFELMGRHLLSKGAASLRVSPKEARKRKGIV